MTNSNGHSHVLVAGLECRIRTCVCNITFEQYSTYVTEPVKTSFQLWTFNEP